VTRQTRLVAVLLVISAAGVFGLMMVANQYRKALAGHAEGGPGREAHARAARLVDGFLAARVAAKAVIARYPDGIGASPGGEEAYAAELRRAFAAHGMSDGDYATVRRAWRAWRAGAPVNDPTLATAFAARRSELARAELGADERLDDAIR
jgi:hypothetical protein